MCSEGFDSPFFLFVFDRVTRYRRGAWSEAPGTFQVIPRLASKPNSMSMGQTRRLFKHGGGRGEFGDKRRVTKAHFGFTLEKRESARLVCPGCFDQVI